MISTALVSIVMPAFNAEKFISEAIDSVVTQEYPHWQLWIVDNGSSDQTGPIVADHLDDRRIRLITLEQNRGVSAGRNAALDRLKGDYLCFLDADDRLPPTSIADRVKRLESDPAISFVDGAVRRIDEQGHELGIKKPSFEGNPFDELLSLSGNCFTGITWMIRMEEGKTYRFREGLDHGEDLLFFLSISGSGIYTTVEAPIYDYRMVKSSAMSRLPSLEKGYRTVYEELSRWPDVTPQPLKHFRSMYRRTMMRAYLKRGAFFNALATYFH